MDPLVNLWNQTGASYVMCLKNADPESREEDYERVLYWFLVLCQSQALPKIRIPSCSLIKWTVSSAPGYKTYSSDVCSDTCLSFAVNLVKEMLQRSCQGLQKLSDFENNPDVADDTFLLASRTLGYAPKLLLADGALVSVVLRSAQAGILLQHRWTPS